MTPDRVCLRALKCNLSLPQLSTFFRSTAWRRRRRRRRFSIDKRYFWKIFFLLMEILKFWKLDAAPKTGRGCRRPRAPPWILDSVEIDFAPPPPPPRLDLQRCSLDFSTSFGTDRIGSKVSFPFASHVTESRKEKGRERFWKRFRLNRVVFT